MGKRQKPPFLCISLPPVIGRGADTLILGSMPGVKSLREARYYAHPQNAFWKIMGALYNASTESYSARLAIIRSNKLALWDVLKSCVREGSLDTAIEKNSIEVNDFAAFFEAQKKITRVFFNGSKAESEFKKRVWGTLPENVQKRLVLKRLPSTSPAHAGQKFSQKLAAWKALQAE